MEKFKRFWNNPEYNSVKVLLIVAFVVGGGSFVYANWVNPLGGRGSVIGYGYGYTYAYPVVHTKTNLPGCISTTGFSLTTGLPCAGGLYATSITTTSATLYGTILSNGGAPIFERGFYYYTAPAVLDTGTFGIGEFSKTITGLTCGTTYTYAAVARNTAGYASTGSTQTFSTLPCSAVTYLPQTVAYLSAEAAGGATFTTAQKDAVDRWFRDMLGYSNPAYPTSNVYSKIKIAYLSLAGIYGADRVNAITPGTFNYTDTGSPTYSTTDRTVRYNGTSQYSDTTFTPNGSTSFTTSNFTGFGIHRFDTTTGGGSNGQVGEVGGGNSYMNLATSWKTIVNGARTAYSQTDTRPINGLWFTSWSNSTTLNTYYNGAKIKTVTSTFNNTPSRSLNQGAIHAAVPVYSYRPSTFDFHIEVLGSWTDAEAKLVYDATKALKSAFGVIWL